MLQQQMYEVISAQLLGAVERGEMVQVDCDAARRVAHAAAKAVIDAADPVVLAHA
jgi:hypothetical protein